MTKLHKQIQTETNSLKRAPLRRPFTLLLALALLLSIAFPTVAFADKVATSDKNTDQGITSFGIASTSVSPNVSFTVPLFVTLAVIGNDETHSGAATVYAPSATSYKLINTGESGYIAVNEVKTEKIGTGTWVLNSSVAATGTTDGNAIKLSVGGVDLGSVGVATNTSLVNETKLLAAPENVFTSTGNLRAIPSKNENTSKYWVEIPFVGIINSNWGVQSTTNDKNAAPQWRITYNVVRVDAGGHKINSHTYSGNVKKYVWDDVAKEFTTQGVYGS